MYLAVTGSSGFVGTRLVKKLLSHSDFDILCLDKVATAMRTPRVRTLQLDLASSDAQQSLQAALNDAAVVIHLAAESYVHDSVFHPQVHLRENTQATFGLLQAIRSIKATPRLIHMSTCEVYGNTNAKGAREADRVEPLSPYAATKLAGEALALSFAHSYGIETFVVRPFNLYGPGQQANRLVPSILRALTTGETIKVTGDGRQTRDWVFVDDAIDLLTKLVDHRGIDSPVTLNAATGRATSVIDMVRTIGSILGQTYQVAHLPELPGALRTSVGCPEHVENLIGWRATTGIIAGLETTVDHYLKSETAT